MGMACNQKRAGIIDAVSVSPMSSEHFSGIGQREFVRVSQGHLPVCRIKHISGVMEGYSIDRTTPLQDEHPDAGDGVAEQTQIFQSSRDINHRVLRDWTPSPFSSPKKRSRHHYEVDEVLEEEDLGESMEIDPIETKLQSSAKDISQRPIKPLRRTLFSGVPTASKRSIPQDHALGVDHNDSRSENPFLE